MRRVDAFIVVSCLASMSSLAFAGDVNGRFNVNVRVQSTAHVNLTPTRTKGAALTHSTNSASFHLSVSEPVRLRIEIIDPVVSSVAISGLGKTVSVGKEPVEVMLPRGASNAGRDLEITYVVRYREGAEAEVTSEPLQLTLLP